MSVYCDANILIKRVLDEGDAAHVVRELTSRVNARETLVTSSLARAEIRRTLLRASGIGTGAEHDHRIDDLTASSLSGVYVESMDEDTLMLAGHLPVRYLGTLDAIHVATALRSHCTAVLTRDRQMARACEELGLAVA